VSAYLNERGLVEADDYTVTLSQIGLIFTDSLKWSVGASQLPTRPARCNPSPNPPPMPNYFLYAEWPDILKKVFNASTAK